MPTAMLSAIAPSDLSTTSANGARLNTRSNPTRRFCTTSGKPANAPSRSRVIQSRWGAKRSSLLTSLLTNRSWAAAAAVGSSPGAMPATAARATERVASSWTQMSACAASRCRMMASAARCRISRTLVPWVMAPPTSEESSESRARSKRASRARRRSRRTSASRSSRSMAGTSRLRLPFIT
ncbi:MAG TPA: hypothetical protein VI160_11370 [Gemmatimonadales bacterium]